MSKFKVGDCFWWHQTGDRSAGRETDPIPIEVQSSYDGSTSLVRVFVASARSSFLIDLAQRYNGVLEYLANNTDLKPATPEEVREWRIAEELQS